MRLYEVAFSNSQIMNFWAENFSHAEDQAIDAEPELAIESIGIYSEEDTGSCDICELPYITFRNDDHCIECGNCFEHCVDKKTHLALQSTINPEAV